jgi:arsenate reductase
VVTGWPGEITKFRRAARYPMRRKICRPATHEDGVQLIFRGNQQAISMMFRKSFISFALVCGAILMTAMCAPAGTPQSPAARRQKTVVFVCEHGAARSVIAAAWFNKLAAERHLPYVAIARGVAPQDALSTATVAGLKKEGISFPDEKPRPLTDVEAAEAVRVVAFCPLLHSMKPARLESFDVPAPSDGYDQSRDAILVHVRKLIHDLEMDPHP